MRYSVPVVLSIVSRETMAEFEFFAEGKGGFLWIDLFCAGRAAGGFSPARLALGGHNAEKDTQVDCRTAGRDCYSVRFCWQYLGISG